MRTDRRAQRIAGRALGSLASSARVDPVRGETFANRSVVPVSADPRRDVPDLILTEVDYFLRAQREALRKLVADILDPATTYELVLTEPLDLVRALHIDARFASLDLGLVDSVVCAVAERREVFRILTSDVRDFSAVRIGPRYDPALSLTPERS